MSMWGECGIVSDCRVYSIPIANERFVQVENYVLAPSCGEVRKSIHITSMNTIQYVHSKKTWSYSIHSRIDSVTWWKRNETKRNRCLSFNPLRSLVHLHVRVLQVKTYICRRTNVIHTANISWGLSYGGSEWDLFMEVHREGWFIRRVLACKRSFQIFIVGVNHSWTECWELCGGCCEKNDAIWGGLPRVLFRQWFQDGMSYE